jgi:hypothetical protein
LEAGNRPVSIDDQGCNAQRSLGDALGAEDDGNVGLGGRFGDGRPSLL